MASEDKLSSGCVNNDHVLNIYASHAEFKPNDTTIEQNLGGNDQKNSESRSDLEDDDYNVYDYYYSKESDIASIDHLSDGEEEVLDKFKALKDHHRNWKVVPSGESRFEVKNVYDWFKVDERLRTCTCRGGNWLVFHVSIEEGSTSGVNTPNRSARGGTRSTKGDKTSSVSSIGVRCRGRGDGSRSRMYPDGIRPIGYDISWDLIDGETILGEEVLVHEHACATSTSAEKESIKKNKADELQQECVLMNEFMHFMLCFTENGHKTGNGHKLYQ
uniref:Tetratricopeptide-like helical domain, DYW domain protein n=1 Tax=Tanacetum cinerariifolium TaxID=118510 RepID=A0A6L2ME34_TANCI|nr:tetratricopeptide-like helical domain, DYW domain protein [Tanacetum cinerariifolium]